ncbi:hypothetical protein DKX38_000191 [Salix brachista]|uniref:Uncharacterized protein n=1 Tax=Salix brachista TaxID=2182728 RepID=A0A5N5P1D1_9ROSI|nr:hypothetical protein DKX38_000191 [Salix brachista]
MMRQPSASSTNLSPLDYHHHHPPQAAPGPPHPNYEGHGDGYGGKRMRKLTQRRAVDYTSTVVRFKSLSVLVLNSLRFSLGHSVDLDQELNCLERLWIFYETRMWQRDSRDRTILQHTPAAAIDVSELGYVLPTVAYSDNPSTSFAAKFVHTSLNKNRCSINQVLAHDQAIRSMVWSHNDNWMVSGDDGGAIKYWQSNMNNVKANKSAHKESVQGVRTDLKFCSCSDDTTVKVWDFARCHEERSLTGGYAPVLAGHGWDVKSVDWHPTKSLLVSGGKDNLVKLWDAKSGKELCSFHGHKNTVLCVKWNQNGNWVLTASKDQIIKLYDIRAMKELESFRGHRKDVTGYSYPKNALPFLALAWHPFHEEYFVSGSYDGSIFHWLVGHETPQIEVSSAHDNSVWDLAWHPIGYLLCSGSNDHTTKFWCRNRPGDTARDKFNTGQNQGYGEQNPALGGRFPGNFPVPEPPTTPGPFAPGLTRNEGTIPGVGAAMPLSIQSLDASQGDQKQPLPISMSFGGPPLPPGPHPSLLAANQQQGYQQNPQQMPQQQHQPLPQHMPPLPMPPPSMQQLQPPSHAPLLSHLHLPRPPQMPPHGMPSPMGMQGTMNQMVPPLQQGHFMGMNPMHAGSLSTSAAPPVGGGFPNGQPNMQGPSNATRGMYQQGGPFNRPQGGQMPMMPGFNPYQVP